MKPLNYILDENNNPQPEWDLMKWGEFFEQTDRRRVARTETPRGNVSTVFLGMDHSFSNHGPPILFETMVFGGPYDQYMERYATWKEAEVGHERWVKLITTEVLPFKRG